MGNVADRQTGELADRQTDEHPNRQTGNRQTGKVVTGAGKQQVARIDDLEAIAKRSKKPLPWYGLAMEYRSLGRLDDAVTTFAKVHEIDARYVPAYFMCAQVHAERNDVAKARAELERGIAVAREVGDAHAEGEMAGMLETLA